MFLQSHKKHAFVRFLTKTTPIRQTIGVGTGRGVIDGKRSPGLLSTLSRSHGSVKIVLEGLPEAELQELAADQLFIASVTNRDKAHAPAKAER